MKRERPDRLNFKPGDFESPAEQFNSVELKYDGHYCVLELIGTEWTIWTHTGNRRREGSLDVCVSRTLLHGEFLFGTEWAKDRPDLYGQFAIFQAEMIDGEDVSDESNAYGRRLIKQFLDEHQRCKFLGKTPFLVQQFAVSEAEYLWDEFVIGQKFEGLIFKNSDRPWHSPMGRMKAETDMDYVCVGFDHSTSNTYAGWGVKSINGGLFVDGELKLVCRVPGLTNELRKEFYDHPDKYIGRVFEAQGKKLSKKGALRHPNFIRWRDDKSKEECTWPRK